MAYALGKKHFYFEAYARFKSGAGSEADKCEVRLGNAILSSWPIRKSAHTPLPEIAAGGKGSEGGGGSDGRGVVVSALIQGPRGPLTVIPKP